MSLVDDVRAGIAGIAALGPRDHAIANLALLYAQRIDAAAAGDIDDWGDKQRDPVAELGPKLLACLVQLGMTPAARKGIVGDKPEAPKRSPLDELRAKREARQAT